MVISYYFGIMIIYGKRYTDDLYILGDRVHPNWWRKESHVLFLEDMQEVLAFNPEVVVVGTGESGMLMVSQEVQDFLERSHITLIIQTTREAVVAFNESYQKQKTAGLFHLTC